MEDSSANSTDIKILLVDDEVNITKALRRLLMRDEGYDIFVADSGVTALSILREEEDIAVIVSDQRMPGMTGVEFLQQARAIVPDAVRMLLTGYADIEASIAAINQGAIFRYLTKPWDDDVLLRAIAEASSNYKLVAENKRLNALVAKQKEELEQWNTRLKQRVLDQTSLIRSKGDEVAESHKRLQQSFDSTIEILSGLIEMRDRKSPGHSRNVAELAAVMAEKLHLSEDEKMQIYTASLLHDIGKIGMSDRAMGMGPDELKGVELQEFRDHVVRGQAVVAMVPALSDIGLLIRHHHENFDGSGFPDRLKGQNIPIGARIISAAERYERVLSQHPQDTALEAALKAIEGEWNQTLDPALRHVLTDAAKEVFARLDLSAEVIERKVSPQELEQGMQLQHDLYSGTGVLLLRKGTIFDDASISAVTRCYMIDPFEREITVILRKTDA